MPKQKRSDKVEILMPPAFIAQIDAVAKAHGLNRSAFVRLAAAELMAEWDRREVGK